MSITSQTVAVPPVESPAREAWRMFLRNKAAVFGLVLLTAIIVITLLGPFVYPMDPMDIVWAPMTPPGTEATVPLGTDYLGRDIMGGLIHGGRATLAVGAAAAFLTIVIGVTLGSLAGYYGGVIEEVLMRVTEFFQVLPTLLFAMVIVALFSASLPMVAFAIGVVSWPPTARLARAEFIKIKQLEFVTAARSIGAEDGRIIWRVILPNALPPLIVSATLMVGTAILFEAGLSFLGLTDPNVMSWGLMIGSSREYVLESWWSITLPGGAIFLHRAQRQPDRRRAQRRVQPEAEGALIMTEPILSVDNVQVEFKTRAGIARVLDGVSFDIEAGKTLGIVGESGCGKSMTALTIMGLVPSPPGQVVGGAVRLKGENMFEAKERRMREIRGNEISMIFQEPLTSLNPVYSCGDQIAETIRLHEGLSRKDANDKAVEMIRSVGIPNPRRRASEYPHQMSGGMRQRLMIAMALACSPSVLIADEPTTALDVTVQAQIFDLLRELQDTFNTAIILITHDMGAIADMADRVMVMYAGRVIEESTVDAILDEPLHPYTQGLINCVPHLEAETPRERPPLMEIPGVVPPLTALGKGCAFAPRCAHVHDRCLNQKPASREHADDHRASCFKLETEGEAA